MGRGDVDYQEDVNKGIAENRVPHFELTKQTLMTDCFLFKEGDWVIIIVFNGFFCDRIHL